MCENQDSLLRIQDNELSSCESHHVLTSHEKSLASFFNLNDALEILNNLRFLKNNSLILIATTSTESLFNLKLIKVPFNKPLEDG